MSISKPFLVLVFCLGFTGCQTVEVGSGPITLSKDAEIAFSSYLALPAIENGQITKKAFAVNPNTNRYSWHLSWGGRNPESRAITKTMSSCGSGCKMFAKGDTIVWEGFSEKKKLIQLSDKLGNAEDLKVRDYDPSIFSISDIQKKIFQEEYLPAVHKYNTRLYIFAISPDGITSDFNYQSGSASRFHIKQLLISNCNALAGKEGCVIYAYGANPVISN